MTELYHPSPSQEADEETTAYWKLVEQDALRALNYARKMLGQLALEHNELTKEGE